MARIASTPNPHLEELVPTTGSAQAVVLARADLFPDALAGAPLAVAKGGPLELTSLSGPSFIDPRTVTEIQRVLTPGKTIFVLGGPAAIVDNVSSRSCRRSGTR